MSRTNLICANVKPRDVVHSSISMSSSSSGSTMLASLASSMFESVLTWKGIARWAHSSLVFGAILGGVGGGRLLDTGRLLEGASNKKTLHLRGAFIRYDAFI